MSFGFRQEQSQKYASSHAQSLELKQLLSCRQIFVSPWESNVTPSKGLEGMVEAHKILLTRHAVGVLIGGLSERVWGGHGRSALRASKDVDVMVPTESFQLCDRFEGGIDWWLPHTERVDTSSMSLTHTWYENANSVSLAFGVMVSPDLSPGLYLPNAEFLVQMRMFEAIEGVNRGGAVIDDEVLDAFEAKLNKKMNKEPSVAVAKFFSERVLELESENQQGLGNDRVRLRTPSQDVIFEVRSILAERKARTAQDFRQLGGPKENFRKEESHAM